MIQRGEIWWAEMDEPTRSGPGYRRPVVIVQADSFNASPIRTAIVAVISTNLRLAQAPGNVELPVRDSGLPKRSVANVSQLIAIDRSRLTDRVRRLPVILVREIDEGLRLVLNLPQTALY